MTLWFLYWDNEIVDGVYSQVVIGVFTAKELAMVARETATETGKYPWISVAEMPANELWQRPLGE